MATSIQVSSELKATLDKYSLAVTPGHALPFVGQIIDVDGEQLRRHLASSFGSLHWANNPVDK